MFFLFFSSLEYLSGLWGYDLKFYKIRIVIIIETFAITKRAGLDLNVNGVKGRPLDKGSKVHSITE